MTPTETYAVARALEGLSDAEARERAGLTSGPSEGARDLARRLRKLRDVPPEARRSDDYAARADAARARARDLAAWARACALYERSASKESA